MKHIDDIRQDNVTAITTKKEGFTTDIHGVRRSVSVWTFGWRRLSKPGGECDPEDEKIFFYRFNMCLDEV